MLTFIAEKSLLSTEKSADGNSAYIWTVIASFLFALITFARSIAFRVTKGIRDSESDSAQNIAKMAVDSISKEESVTKTNLPPSALKRLGELEERVDMLQSKSNVMPYEREKLLNAAVYRVDVLESELIATKKVTDVYYMKSHYSCLAKVLVHASSLFGLHYVELRGQPWTTLELLLYCRLYIF